MTERLLFCQNTSDRQPFCSFVNVLRWIGNRFCSPIDEW